MFKLSYSDGFFQGAAVCLIVLCLVSWIFSTKILSKCENMNVNYNGAVAKIIYQDKTFIPVKVIIKLKIENQIS